MAAAWQRQLLAAVVGVAVVTQTPHAEAARPTANSNGETKPPPTRARNGTGLLIGGSFVTLAGIGGIAMMAIGFPMVAAARDLDENVDLDARADLIRRGQNGNRLVLGGAGLAITLLPTGIAMLAIGGARKRRSLRSVAFAPAVGPSFAGVRFRGRF